TIEYEGEKRSSGEMTLAPGADNEFSGNFTDLKESVKFRAVARNYKTMARQITVVPPPALGELYKEEAQPAYLFHRPPVGGKLDDLKGLKQQFARERVYLGDENITIGVPVGTDLKLIGVVDKDLVNVPEIKPNKDRSGASLAPVQKPEVQLLADRRTFEISF